MLCFSPLMPRAKMSLSISANTNFYEYIQMHFLHIVVETVLNSWQRTFLDLVDRFFLQRERATFSTSLMGRLHYPALDCAEVATSTFLIPASLSKGSTGQCLLLLSQNWFWQLESLDLREWVGVVCYRAKKVIPPLHVTLVRLIELYFSKIERILGFWSVVTS